MAPGGHSASSDDHENDDHENSDSPIAPATMLVVRRAAAFVRLTAGPAPRGACPG